MKLIVSALFIAGLLFVGTLAVRLWVAPSLPDLGLGDEAASSQQTPPLLRPEGTPPSPAENAAPSAAQNPILANRAFPSNAARPPVVSNSWGGAKSPAIYASVSTWSGSGLESLETHLSGIDVVLPQWYEIASAGGNIRLESAGRRNLLANYIAENKPAEAMMPVVDSRGDPYSVTMALSSPASRQHIVESLASTASASGYGGFCLDFSGVSPESHENALLLLSELKQAFHETGLQACLVIALNGSAWPLEKVASTVDRVILLAFDEPQGGSPPAPLAAQGWFVENVAAALGRLDPARTVVALGNVAYEWVTGEFQPRQIDYPTATRLAALHGAEIHLDPASLNSTFSFVDAAGRRHQVWFLDAVSAHNELVELSKSGVEGIALWPIGGEDPSFWSLFGKKTTPPADADALLKHVSVEDYVGFEGEGDFLKVVGTPIAGTRLLEKDPVAGLLVGEKYEKLPQGYTVHRWGRGQADEISLTFDDGPDPTYTPRILDTLKALDVPAAFFVIGANALKNPELVRRMVDEGHEVGSHTYWHENISMAPSPLIRLGLNATQRTISGITGRKTVLFRAPYGEDTDPATASDARPLTVLSELGYIAVGTQIDPGDWRGPGVDTIVSSVRDAALRGDGNIVVLHDAGGDRTQTVEALPKIIEALRADGFHFVSLGKLIGKTRDELMPLASGPDVVIDSWLGRMLSFFRTALVTLFAVALVLGVARTVLIVALALLRRRHPPARPGFAPPVTVIVPAFCEETVIVESIASLLASDYPNLNVLVVDDGSTDRTYAVVQEAYRGHPRVRIVSQGNQGKAAALNHGYRIAPTSIVVAIDADTRLASDAIGLLVRHFEDSQVGAVSGNVKVINRRNLLARLQALEYIVSQNLDRRAFETINAIAVVPGAIGAWRKEAVAAAGGLSSETLAEDADLTFALIRAGYLIVYEEDAIALTQAPQTVRQFLRQRFRWIFGMLQTAWKHRRAVFEGRPIGVVGVPNILLFGTLLPLLAPLADLLLVIAVLGVAADRIQHPMALVDRTWLYAMLFYGVYLASDLVLGIIAFGFEPKERKSLLLWMVFQRFFYRQLLYFVVFRAVFFALTGRLAGWRKVTRILTAVQAGGATRRGDRRVIDLKWEGPERRRWNRRAIDLKWGGSERRRADRAKKR